MRFSSGSATTSCISCAVAPGHAAVTVNILIVNVGSSARPSVRYATAPAMIIARRKNKVTERSRTARAERLSPCTPVGFRSEEHTSELQSHLNLVCRLLLEKKKETQRRQ